MWATLKKWWWTVTGALTVVFFALVADAQSVPYIAAEPPLQITPACGAKLGASIQAVFPNAALAQVRAWECSRDTAAAQVSVLCSGIYSVSTTAAVWRALAVAGSHQAMVVTSVAGDQVSYEIFTRSTQLNTSQLSSLQTFVSACSPSGVEDLVHFRCARAQDDNTKVLCSYVYATSANNDAELAELARQGKVAGVLQPAP